MPWQPLGAWLDEAIHPPHFGAVGGGRAVRWARAIVVALPAFQFVAGALSGWPRGSARDPRATRSRHWRTHRGLRGRS